MSMTMPHRVGLAVLVAVLVVPAGRVALADDEDDDTSTDSLGDQKGSDRVDASDGKVDRSKTNVFEKERFFIDKVDTASTEDTTLFQGNLISSTFFYKESGGAAAGPDANAGGTGANSQFSRLFTDVRFQLDARHIKGGRWQGRVDVRGRAAADPGQVTNNAPGYLGDTRVQSGLTGQSEGEIKELWLARPGDRYDVFIGRQLIADLGALKIDGVRIDYAKSDRVTLLGFAGAYPLRGSRSIDTDYPVLRRNNGTSLGRTPPIAAGAGAAYRTALSYGSVGGGTVAPLKGERPRVFVTSNGYLRTGPLLDVYHFALIDVVSESGFAVNNLSAGINLRPSPSLRATASVNHVDTETLAVQARTFLDPNDASVVRNDAQVRRIASTQGQVGVSASLGRNQQVEVSTSVSVRYRPEVTVPSAAATYTFKASKSVDVFGQIVHRDLLRSRIGVDGVRSFAIGDTSTRSTYLTLRAFLSRDFRGGRGSFDGDLAYSSTQDSGVDAMFLYGKSRTSTISTNGTVFYRLRPSLFLVGSAGIGSFKLKSTARSVAGASAISDPAVLSFSTFLRLAYRF
jgi:hypothetical protein